MSMAVQPSIGEGREGDRTHSRVSNAVRDELAASSVGMEGPGRGCDDESPLCAPPTLRRYNEVVLASKGLSTSVYSRTGLVVGRAAAGRGSCSPAGPADHEEPVIALAQDLGALQRCG